MSEQEERIWRLEVMADNKRLEAENARLTAVLERLADWDDIETARQIAAAALEQKE